jgi:LuxR family maltose regulon positive regulatory protein
VEDFFVSQESLTKLEGKLEGWAAGLRLLSLALRHVADPDGFLKTMQGSLPQIQDYLLQEVLGGLNASVRDCMLASSILDRFCVEALDAIFEVTAHDDDSGFAAADFLEQLRKNNIFTISIDTQRRWFRYHHLFQELLREELQRLHGPEHVAALHLRASRWFEDEGLIDEALKHVLAAEDVERAVGLVARHRHEPLNADQWYVLESWLSLIPTEAVWQHAELLMARAWILLNYYSHVEAVLPLLDEIESLLGDDPGDEEVRGELAASRGYVLWLMGNGTKSLQHVDEALERSPLEHLDFRLNIEIVSAMANQMVGRKAEGLRFLDDLLAHPDSLNPLRRSRLLACRVFIHLTAGDLLEAEVANRRLSTAVERGMSAYVLAWSDYLQGLIHVQRCEWEAAVEFLDRSVAQRFLLHALAAADSMIGLMLAHQALGREDETQAALQTLSEYIASLTNPAMENLAVSAGARLAILQGQSEAARRWVEAIEPLPEGAQLWWIEVPLVTRCRSMIAAGSPGGLTEAVARLQEFAALSEAQHNTLHLVEALTLLAMAYEKQGKTKEALEVLKRSVNMAGKGNVLLPFVELGTSMVDLLKKLTGEREFVARVERLVIAFGMPMDRSIAPEAGAGKPPTGRPDGQRAVAGRNLQSLTNRELDVLEFLALRLQNKEIAARLNISHQTVGSHLKQIYQKLGVQGRREAVERAVERRILNRYPPN